MSLQTTAARKEAPRAKRTTLETVKQGIKQLYPKEDSDSPTTLDVVFVPGLGAHPEDSWKSTKGDFNWASDKHGLQKDYPNARILLCLYESAFHGPLKVDQFLDQIAKGLLTALQSKRDDQFHRPLVFIGHSMGGLVIAKAVTIMDTQRAHFRKMLEATAGCIFFGTPFLGAPAASVAAMFSYFGEWFNQAKNSHLLEMMQPGDASLREIRSDFMRLVSAISPNIKLYSFYENHPTDIAKMAEDFIAKREPTAFGGRLSGAIYDLMKRATGENKIVDQQSATLADAIHDNLVLAANHRDLVKFDDFKDPRYQMIRDPLKKIIHGAALVTKNRLNSTRDIDPETLKNITEAFESASPPLSRKRMSQKFSSSSWLPTDKDFVSWLSGDAESEGGENVRRDDWLWICGAEGRGKTGATIAALEQIDKAIKPSEATVRHDSGKAPVLLAYYFCNTTAEPSTADEVLKSLILQLIQKQPLLASYAKQFTKREGRNPVPTSVENLWQSLQDILSDNTATSKIYFVINNLHGLPPESDATKKLLDYVRCDIQSASENHPGRVVAKWMFTSRKENKSISEAVQMPGVRLIDLEDEKYADQVQLELRKHALKRVEMLGISKKYKKDLAYFVSSLIGNRALNTGWIDLTCGQLEELPETENPLQVRKTLKTLPRQLDDLLDEGWKQIFRANPHEAEKIEDMLQALALTFEAPTLAELAVLSGFPADEQGTEELRDLVLRCKSFLALDDDTVYFKNSILKPHLLRHAQKILNMPEEEIRWLHGEMALRSFLHLMERFDIPGQTEGAAENGGEKAADPPLPTPSVTSAAPAVDEEQGPTEPHEEAKAGEVDESEEDDGDDEKSEEGSEEDEDEDDSDEESEQEEYLALPYMVKYWLHHASKATVDMAESLSLEESFWKPGSAIRRRWMIQYDMLTDKFDGFPFEKWTTLHVAASVGFRHLVSALIKNGYKGEIDTYDDFKNCPLHLAAWYGQPDIVEELILKGAEVDGGKELNVQTPLSMAAQEGATKVMSMLLAAGADPNTLDNQVGPPLNCAIMSGNFEAVKILVEKGAKISKGSLEGSRTYMGPLSNAAKSPDSAAFRYLLEVGKDVLTTEDYGEALKSAAYYGNLETLQTLLSYDISPGDRQQALKLASNQAEWEIARVILDAYAGLDCNILFGRLATTPDDQGKFLNTAWRYPDGKISAETLNQALYEATDNEKEGTVKYLLETCKTDPNASGDVFGNALTASAYDGTLGILKMLLDAGARIDFPGSWPLQAAAQEGHEDVVKELLARGADVNACTTTPHFQQGTALQAACEAGKVAIVRLLLESGADPNLGAGELTCPILSAAWKGEREILELLVKHGAKVDLFGGPDMSTPLINATMNLPTASLEVLVGAGADVNVADKDGDTALIMAALYGGEESVKFLLDKGANVLAVSHNAEQGRDGLNALQAAYESKSMTCMKLLIDRVSELLSKSRRKQEAHEAEHAAAKEDREKQSLPTPPDSQAGPTQDPASQSEKEVVTSSTEKEVTSSTPAGADQGEQKESTPPTPPESQTGLLLDSFLHSKEEKVSSSTEQEKTSSKPAGAVQGEQKGLTPPQPQVSPPHDPLLHSKQEESNASTEKEMTSSTPAGEPAYSPQPLPVVPQPEHASSVSSPSLEDPVQPAFVPQIRYDDLYAATPSVQYVQYATYVPQAMRASSVQPTPTPPATMRSVSSQSEGGNPFSLSRRPVARRPVASTYGALQAQAVPKPIDGTQYQAYRQSSYHGTSPFSTPPNGTQQADDSQPQPQNNGQQYNTTPGATPGYSSYPVLEASISNPQYEGVQYAPPQETSQFSPAPQTQPQYTQSGQMIPQYAASRQTQPQYTQSGQMMPQYGLPPPPQPQPSSSQVYNTSMYPAPAQQPAPSQYNGSQYSGHYSAPASAPESASAPQHTAPHTGYVHHQAQAGHQLDELSPPPGNGGQPKQRSSLSMTALGATISKLGRSSK